MATGPADATGQAQTTSDEAADIMGNNFYSLGDAMYHFGNKIPPKQADDFEGAIIPYSSAVLRTHASTHVLVPGIPASIMDLHTAVPELFTFPASDGPWYRTRIFATTPLSSGWRLVRLGPIPKTLNKPTANN